MSGCLQDQVAQRGGCLGTNHELRASCGMSAATLDNGLRTAQPAYITMRSGPGDGLFASRQVAHRAIG